jgi:hypothetical protein
VFNDAINCRHLPLDVRSGDELRMRYLKEFVPSMYHFDDERSARVQEGIRQMAERKGRAGDPGSLSPEQKRKKPSKVGFLQPEFCQAILGL